MGRAFFGFGAGGLLLMLLLIMLLPILDAVYPLKSLGLLTVILPLAWGFGIFVYIVMAVRGSRNDKGEGEGR